jgi:hypothetical protein
MTHRKLDFPKKNSGKSVIAGGNGTIARGRARLLSSRVSFAAGSCYIHAPPTDSVLKASDWHTSCLKDFNNTEIQNRIG